MKRTERPFKDRQFWPRLGIMGQAVLLLGVAAFAGSLWHDDSVSTVRTNWHGKTTQTAESIALPASGSSELGYKMKEALDNDDIMAVQNLLNAGEDINNTDVMGKSALVYAHSLEMTRLLISRGAYVDAQDHEGLTPLMYAAASMTSEQVRVLLEAGANVNTADSEGMTALMYAVDNEDASPVRYLLAHGANVHLKCSDGQTALDRAQRHPVNPESIRLLEAAQ